MHKPWDIRLGMLDYVFPGIRVLRQQDGRTTGKHALTDHGESDVEPTRKVSSGGRDKRYGGRALNRPGEY